MANEYIYSHPFIKRLTVPELSEDEKRIAVNFAMRVDIGLTSIKKARECLNGNPLERKMIMDFWKKFNPMTHSVARRIELEENREKLEVCYGK